MKYKTLILPPRDRLDDICSPACYALLETHYQPTWNETGRDYDQTELRGLIQDAEVVVTSWGSPHFSEEILSNARHLKAVAHAAGSVKHLLPRSIFDHNVAVFSAASRIAQSVAEYCLAAVLGEFNGLHRFDQTLREQGWGTHGARRREVRGATIGVVSAGSTARAFIRLLSPFDCHIRLYDPFLSDEAARELGVQRASLEEVMQCPIISVHAPAIPSTDKMITSDLLKRIPDGALLINSSRAAVFDDQALLSELNRGRFHAVIDVFSTEPMAANHPLLTMSNVILTPHIAGDTVGGHLGLMEIVLQDVCRYFEGRTTSCQIRQEHWEMLA